jgi:hypothetical protein
MENILWAIAIGGLVAGGLAVVGLIILAIVVYADWANRGFH